jgi:hypothetical protein
MTQATSEDLASQNSSWAESLADPIADTAGLETGETPPDTTTEVNPPAGFCERCGEGIYREPGARGRTPKYHPECRAVPKGSSGPRTIRVSRADALVAAEAEQAAEAFDRIYTRIAGMVSLVDAYDAYVMMVNRPDLRANLYALATRYEWLRKELLAIETGGSIFGLIVSVLSIFIPIAAHHGLFGRNKVSTIMINAPFMLEKLNDRMSDGEAMTKMLRAEVMEKARKLQEQAQRQRQAETDGN